MAMEPVIQAEFERNYAWKRSWPRCFIAFLAALEMLLGLIIFLTEAGNILMDFWHTNIFGGIWAGIVIFIHWILLFVTACCTPTVGAARCALIWNLVALVALGNLIGFDIIFILHPDICLLTPTCSTQPQVVSLIDLLQKVPVFKYYTTHTAKKLFLEIQVVCVGIVFLMCLMYIVVYIACRMNIRTRVQDSSTIAASAPPCSGAHHEFPVAQAAPFSERHHLYPVLQAPPPPIFSGPQHEFPADKTPQLPWTVQAANAPYAPC
ncbi:unnamed protein product [Adineta steineri]|uniref:Uncharacterized protein n=1 Tax=Adineta steineri TaxID=433720 RepID=A0A819NY50_9BILA|nr:unnamed protein product [Adineta steineri]CAF4001971.1 unnamed protein product [Adineta steineri]